MRLNKEGLHKWVDGLKSGRYTQTVGALERFYPEENLQCNCALGVLMHECGYEPLRINDGPLLYGEGGRRPGYRRTFHWDEAYFGWSGGLPYSAIDRKYHDQDKPEVSFLYDVVTPFGDATILDLNDGAGLSFETIANLLLIWY